MKKVLLIAAVAGIAMISCKKQYSCECTTTSTVYINGKATTNGPTTSSGKFDDKMKKKDAKSKCEEGNKTTTTGDTQNGGKIEVSGCTLKD